MLEDHAKRISRELSSFKMDKKIKILFFLYNIKMSEKKFNFNDAEVKKKKIMLLNNQLLYI